MGWGPLRYRARLVLTSEGVVRNGVIRVEGSKIAGVERHGPFDVDLGDVAVVPGLVNAHSHAFQRVIRGKTEFVRSSRLHDDVWSWRNLMFSAASSIDPQSMVAVSRMAFLEMALSGITHVGEFHYIHSQADGTPYPDPNELGHRVIQSARDVGLRITLLKVAYARGGFRRDPEPHQRRFIESDVTRFLQGVEALSSHHAGDPFVGVGLAPHSIRAVPGDWLRRIAEFSEATGKVLHVHACEQRREIEEARSEYGASPIAVFQRLGLLTSRTTIVHGTHLEPGDLDLLEACGPTVCACPTTERNLGDGFLPAFALFQRGIPVSLGSDSQAQIDLWEDCRLVEYHERLLKESRNVLAATRATDGSKEECQLNTADALWPLLNAHGGRSLGLDVSPGLTAQTPADFITIDLRDPSVAGTSPEALKADLVFSLRPHAIRDVFVGGNAIVRNGTHALQQEIIDGFLEAQRQLAMAR